jgi:hypothetical protein
MMHAVFHSIATVFVYKKIFIMNKIVIRKMKKVMRTKVKISKFAIHGSNFFDLNFFRKFFFFKAKKNQF